MNKNDFLKQYVKLDSRINRKLEERERWKSKAEKVTSTITDMPRGGDGENQRELAIIEMVDCDIEANQLIDQLCDLREQIRHYILTTGDNDSKLLVVLETER